MKNRTAAILLFILAALHLTGCTTTPVTHFYTLAAHAPVEGSLRSDLVLALGPVELPRYLDRPQLVTRVDGNRLKVDEFNRWGGSLEEEITRVLAQHIGRSLGTQHIYSYPSRVVADSDYRLALDIRGFDGMLAGEVRLEVAWSLIADYSGEVVKTHQASYRSQAAAGGGYEAYVAALSDTLSQLGRDLAALLAALPPVRQR